MTKELIIQSTKHTGSSIIIDFMLNGVWCKTSIKSIDYLNWLKNEAGMIVHFMNLKELLKSNEILAEYVSHAISNKHPFVILDELHNDANIACYNLISGVKGVSLSK